MLRYRIRKTGGVLVSGNASPQTIGHCRIERRTRMNIPKSAVAAVMLTAVVVLGPQAEAAAQDCLGTSPLDCQRVDIVDSDLSGRSMFGANFRAATLTDVNFSKSGLVVALFDRAKLDSVTFDGANLRGASFTGAEFDGVSFLGADLSGARFDDARLDAALLGSALTCNTTMPNGRMNNSDCDI